MLSFWIVPRWRFRILRLHPVCHCPLAFRDHLAVLHHLAPRAPQHPLGIPNLHLSTLPTSGATGVTGATATGGASGTSSRSPRPAKIDPGPIPEGIRRSLCMLLFQMFSMSFDAYDQLIEIEIIMLVPWASDRTGHQGFRISNTFLAVNTAVTSKLTRQSRPARPELQKACEVVKKRGWKKVGQPSWRDKKTAKIVSSFE